MASVAKWLRQWIVVPPFAGSSPVVRPILPCLYNGTFTTNGVTNPLHITHLLLKIPQKARAR